MTIFKTKSTKSKNNFLCNFKKHLCAILGHWKIPFNLSLFKTAQ